MPADPLRISAEFWLRVDVRTAMRSRDVGGLFELIVRYTGASQGQIGAAVGLDQGYVSRIMAGRRVTSIEVLERIADGCAVPDAARDELGLAARRAVQEPSLEQPSSDASRDWPADAAAMRELWLDDVNRRRLLRHTFSVGAYTAPALRWFTAADQTVVGEAGPRLVGQPDVDTIREMTAAFRRLDNHFGGGHARETVARYLHEDVLPMLTEGRFDAATGRALLAATAELTQLAGWQAYDMADHGTAQRYLVHALSLARAADDEALGAEILGAMSHQATYLGNAAEAVDLARAAGQAARRTPVAALAAEALVLEAHGRAIGGDARTCGTLLHQAERALDRADRGSDPQWISYFDEAYLSAKFGHCFHALGQHAHAEKFARRSLEMDSRYVRGRVFNLALLATACAQQKQPDQACAIGGQALELTINLRSARAVSYLRDLRHHLAGQKSHPAVRRFNARFDATLGRRPSSS